jgi:signal transduction histidine kinase
VHWGQETEQELLSPDEEFNEQLGPGRWLILPLTWQKQTLGVLLLAVDTSGPADISDDRWAILTSLVSQAAVALGTVDRTRRLAMEEERNRIARDIHDTVAQSLFGIVFTLDACAKLLPKQAEMVKKELTELRDVADEVRHQVRQSILDIWPSDLTEDKFKADLSKYVTDCAPDHVFTVDFTISGNFDGLPARVRRSLYRVCQEALANAARHAGVDMARVYLYVEPEEVHLSIRDTGRGFDPKEALARERNRERFGLRSMQERVQTLGGTCDILSQGSQGTQILVRVPVG